MKSILKKISSWHIGVLFFMFLIDPLNLGVDINTSIFCLSQICYASYVFAFYYEVSRMVNFSKLFRFIAIVFFLFQLIIGPILFFTFSFKIREFNGHNFVFHFYEKVLFLSYGIILFLGNPFVLSKSIVSGERKRNVEFHEFSSDYFACLMFFPAFWIIIPRIKKVIENIDNVKE